jgi:benzoylformate decarboxylase
VARGFGCHAVDAGTAEDLEQEFKRGLSADGPTVIVIPTKPTMDAD